MRISFVGAALDLDDDVVASIRAALEHPEIRWISGNTIAGWTERNRRDATAAERKRRQRQRAKLREAKEPGRAKHARREKAKSGGFIGGVALYGWHVEGERLVIDESEAPVVQLMLDMESHGLPRTEIARALNAEGLRTRRGLPWQHGAIGYILKNRKTQALAGHLSRSGVPQSHVLREGAHEAIVRPPMSFTERGDPSEALCEAAALAEVAKTEDAASIEDTMELVADPEPLPEAPADAVCAAGPGPMSPGPDPPDPPLDAKRADAAAPRRIGIMELTSRSCRWPEGDPRLDGFGFCGRTAVDGRPYCPKHMAIAHAPTVRAEGSARPKSVVWAR